MLFNQFFFRKLQMEKVDSLLIKINHSIMNALRSRPINPNYNQQTSNDDNHDDTNVDLEIILHTDVRGNTNVQQ
jgi:hypothetical protein